MFRLPLLVIAMLALSAAVPHAVLAAEPPAELCGSWEHRAAGNLPPLTMTLRPDGSGTLGDESIRFSVRGDQLIVVIDEESTPYTFVLEGGTLTLSGGDLEGPTSFVRLDAPAKRGIGARLGGAEPRAAAPVGSWEVRTERGALRFVFDPDGGGSMSGVPLRWTFHDGDLAITLKGNTTSYHASFTASTLQLSGGDLAQDVTLQKVAGGAQSDGRLAGKWRDASGSVIEFRPDGSGVNRRGAFHYTASDGVLMFDDGAALVLLTYRVEGTQLSVDSHGETATFTRAQAGAAVRPRSGVAPAGRRVVVNQTRLTEAEVGRLEQAFHVRVLDGEYWYDRASGAWGMQGGPTMGLLPPRLALGGELRADASGGGTGVFINGRELHPLDVAALQRITPVQPGRYWVDERGNCGYEGNPTPLLNLVQLANAAQSRSGGSYHSRSDITGIGSGGDGRTSYVMGKDFSVIIGE